MSLVLYHFAPAHAIEKIRAQGLTKGVLPWNRAKDGTPQLLRNMSGPHLPGPGFQWLTSNASFDQPWCLLGDLPVAKNAFRLTVLIPPQLERFCFAWPKLCERCRPDSAEELNAPGTDWQSWFVYHGRIPPSWFLVVERNTGERFSPLLTGAVL